MSVVFGDIIELRVVCYTPAQIGMNVLHGLVSASTGVGVEEAQIATTFDATLSTSYKPLLSSGARYRGVGVRRIRPLPIGVEFATSFSDGVGTVAGDMLPKQVSGLIGFRTLTAGPKGRGRAYIPFPGETDSDSLGQPVAGYVTRLTALASLFMTPWAFTQASPAGTCTVRLGVYDRVTGGIVLFSSANPRNRWATQRRRGDYGRLNPLPF